ncbi:DUF4097 family beta strand repeat-containing protein [Cohnella kolymensis]|nr:DUF4097 family beta strand repeat-containing protein [Cohnella kolymensis]
MIRIGRYTAALGMIAAGELLVLDHLAVLDSMAIIGAWWPVLLLMFGIELLFMQLIYRDPAQRMRFDFGGFIAAAILTGFVVIAVNGNQLKLTWLPQWFDGIVHQYSDESGVAFDQGTITPGIDHRTRKISLKNSNGRIIVKQGPVNGVEIHSTVYVSGAAAEEAAEIARQSAVEVRDGDHAQIIANGKPYGAAKMHKPRINLTVTLPQGPLPELDISVDNGAVDLQQLSSEQIIVVEVKNGDARGSGVDARLDVTVFNGKIQFAGLERETTLETMNGSIRADQVASSLTADTKNGSITLNDVHADLKAHTANGRIHVTSAEVGGSWDVSSVIGDVVLTWPDGEDVTVNGNSSFGDINTDWALDVRDHEVSGTLGDGTHRIRVNTHGDLSLQKRQP